MDSSLKMNNNLKFLETRSKLPPSSILKLISDKENEVIQNFCNFTLELESPIPKNSRPMSLPNEIHFNWGAFIADRISQEILCSATFITSIHLITTKDCIYNVLKNNITNLIIIGDGFCLMKSDICKQVDVKKFEIHLIGWRISDKLQDQLAIIQLMPHQMGITPACFINSTKSITSDLLTYSFLNLDEGRVKYSYLKHETESLYCIDTLLICANSPLNFAIKPADRGGAILETKNGGKTVGILLDNKKSKIGVYLDLRKYIDFFCVYLNRCMTPNEALLFNPFSSLEQYYNVQEKKYITEL